MSRDPARIDRIILHLRTLWALYPDQRLGQLVINSCPDVEDMIWHLEDDKWEAALKEKASKCPRCGSPLNTVIVVSPEPGTVVSCTSCTWPKPDPSWSTQK
jgi:uncharacterized protein with PIN domain